MRCISRRVRHRFMKAFVYSTRRSRTNYVDFKNPKVAALKKRKDFSDVVQVLFGLGLVKVHYMPGDPQPRYLLTDAGLSYLERCADERRRAVVNSILVPILVSIVTAMVTLYILQPLGQRASRWLEGLSADTPRSTPAALQSDGPA